MKHFIERIIATLCVAFIVGVYASASSSAAPIYSQVTPSEPLGAFSSINASGFQKVADNFLLTGPDPVTVRSLRFIGGPTGVPIPPSLDDFRIVFLEDTGGMPGSPVAGGDFALGSATLRTLTGGQLLNGVTLPYEYTINFPGGITLSPGIEYWVSISNDLLPDNGWVWARADGLLDIDLASTTDDVAAGPWTLGVSNGMWFELNDQEIPEPTTLTILATVLSICVLRRRSRCPVKPFFPPASS